MWSLHQQALNVSGIKSEGQEGSAQWGQKFREPAAGCSAWLCSLCCPDPLLALGAKLKQKAAEVCVWGVGCITMGLNVSSNACSFVFL